MIGDLLLTWISESGNGTTADFTARAAWLARTEGLHLHENVMRRWLRNAAALGHCEVDWKHGTWSVGPPVISRLPLADGFAILTGSRRPRLIRAIEDGGLYTEQARRLGFDNDIPAPCTIFFPYDRTRDLEEAAATIGAAYTGCSAARIAALLPPAIPATLSAPPAYSSPFEQLTTFSPRKWAQTSPRDLAPADGLYREHINGRWHYKLCREGTWYAADLPAGIFAELARRGKTVIGWRPESDHRTRTGTFIVNWGAPLPPLHSRVLVLCSGFAPRVNHDAKTTLYDNVPREIATRVSSSLGQSMTIKR